jgi:hypothetical protein
MLCPPDTALALEMRESKFSEVVCGKRYGLQFGVVGPVEVVSTELSSEELLDELISEDGKEKDEWHN